MPTSRRGPRASKEAKAKERFAEIGSAYEIIGDEKKRAAFDRGEIDAEGKPRNQGFEGFGGAGRRTRTRQGGGAGFQHFDFDFGGADLNRGAAGGGIDPDILAELFGAQGAALARTARRGEDVAVSATVPLAMAASGGSAIRPPPAARPLGRRRRLSGRRRRPGLGAARP